ncbi:uncharacterized protein LOC143766612 [Ranitomeya variabilis]|uniref:uncharacterized protein LOC143766612 n=1 Tax=Ranitomeya variabilis TaxID=490064 RepID=UPI00405720CA
MNPSFNDHVVDEERLTDSQLTMFLDADMVEECHAAPQCLMAEMHRETVSGDRHGNSELAEASQYPDSQELLTESQQLDAEVMAEWRRDNSTLTEDPHNNTPMYESFIDCTGSDDDLSAVTISDDEACAVQPLYAFTERDTWSPTFPTTSTEETIIDLTGSDDETKNKENTSPGDNGKRAEEKSEEKYTTPSTSYSSPTQSLWRPTNIQYAPRKTARRQPFRTIFEKKEFDHWPPLGRLWNQSTHSTEVNPRALSERKAANDSLHSKPKSRSVRSGNLNAGTSTSHDSETSGAGSSGMPASNEPNVLRVCDTIATAHKPKVQKRTRNATTRPIKHKKLKTPDSIAAYKQWPLDVKRVFDALYSNTMTLINARNHLAYLLDRCTELAAQRPDRGSISEIMALEPLYTEAVEAVKNLPRARTL